MPIAPNRALKIIYIENLDAIMAKMKKIDPDLQKEFRRELGKAVRPVAKLAKSFVPNKIPNLDWRETQPTYPPQWGWANDTVHRGRTYGEGKSRWKWSQAEVVKGIRISAAKSKVQRVKGATFGVTALALINSSVPGIIYELAGFGSSRSQGRTRRVSRNRDARQSFVSKLDKEYKALYPGWNDKRLIYRAAYQLKDQTNANLVQVLKKYLGKEFRG